MLFYEWLLDTLIIYYRYEDIAEVAFGKSGRDFMTGILYTELIGTCALFLILEKDHARIIMDSFPQLSGLAGE